MDFEMEPVPPPPLLEKLLDYFMHAATRDDIAQFRVEVNASHSELSRPLVLDQTIGYSKKKLSILQKVGQLHNFELLQDTIKDAQYFN
jgi:hypothetical protein